MERAIATVLPLSFLAQLLASEAVLARRGTAIGGRPPIGRLPFLGCKYLAIGVWIAMALQSWGIGWQPLAGVPALRWVSMGLWVLGFALLFAGRLSLGGHLRLGLPEKATGLHLDGAYGFCRNPMYAGIDATMIAATLYTRNPAVLALGALVIAVHHRIILVEERWLRATFGEDYDRYRERVGRYASLPLAARRCARARGRRRSPGLSAAARAAYRVRALWTLAKMGHCAPTVMRTMLNACGRREDWLVKLVAGLPGGIGNTGGECGGVTSVLVMLGLKHGLGGMEEGLPLVFDQGRGHLRRFRVRNGTLLCREIRGDPPRVWPCVRVIVPSPELYAEALSGESGRVDGRDAREACSSLYAAFVESGFHCARTVLRLLEARIPAGNELLDAAAAFAGGTVFEGMTCGALTAGIMALGLRKGEIEGSRRRVLHMVALMLTGGRAFDDAVNKFNPAMNRGGELAAWFASEFGSTQCRTITRADFSSPLDVRAYIQDGGIAACRRIAERVAERVRFMLGEPAGATPRA